MADEAATIQEKYAGRFASELETNRSEQENLRARLKQLQAEEEMLLRLQSALAGATAGSGSATGGAADAAVTEPQDPAHASAVLEEAGVPQPRHPKTGSPAAPAKKAAAKRTAPARKAAKETAAKKTTAKGPAGKPAADKAAGPSLGDLLKQILDKHPGQPRTAAEVTIELEQEYPERARNTTIVRNTLERLVAKSAVERTKQKSTVLYTSDGPAAADSTTAGSAPAAGEEDEKALAQA
ncbi:hypothetical protein [Streptomyces olivochromogenes]|uniref:hypothetical protein n=1 Tax=Streptomyces olivochromogenes TaxID=1963 RepID=UPI001F39BCCB|nr:hypothetical protein [Streptomyces olivochromogenes]MCF3134767.1 hypothetical protein [Streptomyces olivochromogenes]